MNIRYAKEEDLADVLGMYLSALAEIKDYALEPSLEKCADEVYFSWADAPCFLLEKDGKTVGFAGLKRVTPDYTEQSILSEYMFYIKPEARAVKAAKMLSDAVKNYAVANDEILFLQHKVTNKDINMKQKFLMRWGYDSVYLCVTVKG